MAGPRNGAKRITSTGDVPSIMFPTNKPYLKADNALLSPVTSGSSQYSDKTTNCYFFEVMSCIRESKTNRSWEETSQTYLKHQLWYQQLYLVHSLLPGIAIFFLNHEPFFLAEPADGTVIFVLDLVLDPYI